MSEYKKIENAKCELTATLEGEAWTAAKDAAFNKIAKKIEIKGFRKGQAPKSMLNKYVNRQEVLLDAAEALAQGALEAAIEEHKVELIDRPTLKLDEINEEKCVMTFECPVMPDVTVGDYKGLEYKLDEVKVEDSEVDSDIASLLERKADLELKEDGEVEDGDTCVIDFEGFKDGVPFDGGKGENYDLVIGSHSFIPGFEEALIGMKSEETKDIDVTFPDDYHAEELKGQPVKFIVTVHEIKKKVLPLLDDEFVKGLGMENVTTVEELKNDTKKRLEDRKTRDAESAAEEALLESLVNVVEVEIPDVMIDNETNNMISNYDQRLQQQGLSLSQFLQITNQTVDQMKETMKDDAIKRIKINLGLNEIAKLENVEVNDEDVDKEFTSMSEMYGMDIEELKKYIPVDNVKSDLKVQKTLELLKK
ncbi:MAG: trigger factor [Erysipelotrichaceae bacterium]|nr:trigger factor [Erysipelotrichaceae bacterium]